MTAALHRRVREIQGRLAIRAWEFRQRSHSKGVWFRLRRVLADSAFAYSIDDDDADSLAREGHVELPEGKELAPSKRLFFVSAARAETLPSRNPVAVRLGADLLAARNLALVRFTPR